MDNRYSSAQYPPPPQQGYATPESQSYYPPSQTSGQRINGPPPSSFPSIPTPNGGTYYPSSNATLNGSYSGQSITRQLSSEQMMAVGIKSPDSSNGYNFGGVPPPPTTNYSQQQSPGSGSYATRIGNDSPSSSYSQLPISASSHPMPPLYPSPPSSGYGLPPTGGVYQAYAPPVSGNYPTLNSPYSVSSQGPPTIQTANVGIAGVTPDSPFFGSSGYGQMISPNQPSNDRDSPVRTSSYDGNMPPSPNQRQLKGGNVKRVNSRIDPSQMPRPIRPAEGIVYQTNSGTTTSSGRKIPPTSAVNFKVVDTGNCSPRCLRITSTAPPATKEIANMTGIPLAITATPFAPPEGTEELVPMVDAGENPPRCTRCRGYVNPHVVWSDGGNKWSCNLCAMVNTVPSYYYASLDGVGLRLDRKLRPELTQGTVDFLVGKDFSIRPIQEPIYIYAVDISQRAVASGLTMAAIAAIKANISYLQGPQDRIRVGILTFDRVIHFYKIKEDSASDPIRILISDSDDPVTALPHSSWVLPIATQVSALYTLLDKLPELIPALQGYDKDGNMTRNHPMANSNPASPSQGHSPVPYDEYAQTCPAAVIKAVQLALSTLGGRLFLFSSFSSNIGFGKVTVTSSRDSQSSYGTIAELGSYANIVTAIVTADSRKVSVDEKAVLTTYQELALACSKSYVSVDVLISSESEYLYPDFGLLSEICEATGGNFHMFTGSLLFEDNAIRLQHQLYSMQQAIAGFEVMMKVRCSTGLRVEKVLGRGCYDEGVNELEVAAISTSSTYCCIFKHDAAMKDDDRVHIQLAVLHTSASTGRRCVRVHNLVTTASTQPQQIFRHADLDATVDVLVKQAIDKALRLPLNMEKEGPRAFLTESAIEILQKYRVHCSADSSRGQLILPESLKLLPLYTLCALKHPALLDNFPGEAKGVATGRGSPIYVRGYERAYELRRLRSLPAAQLMNSLYPRTYMIHQLEDNEGEPIQLLEGLNILKMPPVIPTLSEVLDGEGMYLMDDGTALWLHIGRSVPPHKLEEWFGLRVHAGGLYEKPKNLTFNINGSYEAAKMANIVQYLRQPNWTKQELKVIWAGEQAGPDYIRFSLRLVEDSIYGNASYVDFLCKIHAKIQSKTT